MQLEPQIRDIPINSIDEIEWLKIRESEDTDLTDLGHSMATITDTLTNPSDTDDPTSWEDFLLQMPAGQLAPVRVIQYPPELKLSLPKDYGLIFGYRRWHAAKQRGLTTIKAQIIHLSFEEYRNDKIKFALLLMGFTENAAREVLTGPDHFKALKRLKDKYEAIFPKSSKRFKYLTQSRNERGRFGRTTEQTATPFNKAITKKSKQRISEEIQVASLLTSTILNDRYKQSIKKSVGLVLAKLPDDQQVAVLDQLTAQGLPVTIANVEAAIRQSQSHPIDNSDTHATNDRKRSVSPDSGLTASLNNSKDLAHATGTPSNGATRLPGFAIVKATITLCLDLRHNFDWTPAAIGEALPIFDDLLSASQVLADYLRHEKAILDGYISRAPATGHNKAHYGPNESKQEFKHVER